MTKETSRAKIILKPLDLEQPASVSQVNLHRHSSNLSISSKSPTYGHGNAGRRFEDISPGTGSQKLPRTPSTSEYTQTPWKFPPLNTIPHAERDKDNVSERSNSTNNSLANLDLDAERARPVPPSSLEFDSPTKQSGYDDRTSLGNSRQLQITDNRVRPLAQPQSITPVMQKTSSSYSLNEVASSKKMFASTLTQPPPIGESLCHCLTFGCFKICSGCARNNQRCKYCICGICLAVLIALGALLLLILWLTGEKYASAS